MADSGFAAVFVPKSGGGPCGLTPYKKGIYFKETTTACWPRPTAPQVEISCVPGQPWPSADSHLPGAPDTAPKGPGHHQAKPPQLPPAAQAMKSSSKALREKSAARCWRSRSRASRLSRSFSSALRSAHSSGNLQEEGGERIEGAVGADTEGWELQEVCLQGEGMWQHRTKGAHAEPEKRHWLCTKVPSNQSI